MWLLLFFLATVEEPFKGFEEVPEVGPPPELRPIEAVEKEIPFFSVVGNLTVNFSDEPWAQERNKILLERVELALQSWLYPSIRGEAFFSFRRESGTGHIHAEVYEAYGRFLRLGKGLEGLFGRFRPHLGFVNRLHPHHRPFADLPQVVSGFFGPEGLGVEGFSLGKEVGEGTSLEVGIWRPWTEGDALGLAERTVYPLGFRASLGEKVKGSLHWLNREGKGSALWLGVWKEEALGEASWAFEVGYGERPEGGSMRGVYGLVKRPLRGGWEAGLRADYLKGPGGEKKGASLLLSRRILPTVSLLLQAKYSERPEGSGPEFLVWLSWGIGPYAHSLDVAEKVMESVPKEVPK